MRSNKRHARHQKPSSRLVVRTVHCSGHIHEGYGFLEVRWKPQDMELGPVSRELWVREDGRTVLVNAAVMNHGEENHNSKPHAQY